ncbi:hypothetical protein BOTCAL_0044g00140 [Botryotinia calthae]|uniref:Uncharacterized protein n=1 Tax=Botryotinia calthae TaxID=38488 RepID=A0A4Y8DBM0_9HELO|nr:hypothetical protein BOTCAL_0044g00140 [Botryotinia calthae]
MNTGYISTDLEVTVGFQRARGYSWFSTLAHGLDIALLLPTQDRIDVLYINQLNGEKELKSFRDLNVGPAFRTI